MYVVCWVRDRLETKVKGCLIENVEDQKQASGKGEA